MILEESSIELSTSRGSMRTYVYRPKAAGRRPGVVLYSESLTCLPSGTRMSLVSIGASTSVAIDLYTGASASPRVSSRRQARAASSEWGGGK